MRDRVFVCSKTYERDALESSLEPLHTLSSGVVKPHVPWASFIFGSLALEIRHYF